MAKRFDYVYAIKKWIKTAKHSIDTIKKIIKKVISKFKRVIQIVLKCGLPINKFKNYKVLLKRVENVESLENI